MGSPSNWKHYLAKLIELRGGALQVAQYIAVISGLKRSIDDWVPVPQFAEFLSLAAKLGLSMEVDCVFRRLSDSQSAFGINFAPTTRALGKPISEQDLAQLIGQPTDTVAAQSRLRYQPGGAEESYVVPLAAQTETPFVPGDEIHIVLSTRSEWAAEALAAAWYPVIIDGRVIFRPHIDCYRLGAALGYPECCVKFFMEHNDWPRQNQIAETARASRKLSWKANCLAKNTPWMLIFHMPCAFDCPATLQYSSQVLKEIAHFDSTLALKIEAFLKQLVLVANERLSFTLNDAEHRNGRTSYAGVNSLQEFIRLRDPLHDTYIRALSAGNEVSISEGIIFIWRNGDLIETIEASCDRGIAEVPMLLDFRG